MDAVTLPDLQDRVDRIPLPPRYTVDDVTDRIRVIFTKRGIKEVTITRGIIAVRWEGVPGDTLDFDLPNVQLSDVLSDVELLFLEEEKAPLQMVGEAVLDLNKRGLEVSHIVVGPRTALWEWLGINLNPRSVSINLPRRVFGGRVTVDDSFGEDILVVVGSPVQSSPLWDARVGIRINMDVAE